MYTTQYCLQSLYIYICPSLWVCASSDSNIITILVTSRSCQLVMYHLAPQCFKIFSSFYIVSTEQYSCVVITQLYCFLAQANFDNRAVSWGIKSSLYHSDVVLCTTCKITTLYDTIPLNANCSSSRDTFQTL